MRRGTRVGQAYVAVSADGSGINEEIVDSIDEAGPDVEKAGDEHGKRYGNKFGEGLRGRLDGVRDRLGKALSDRLGSAGDEAGTKFADRLESRLDSAGDRIGHSLGASIADALGDRLELTLAGLIDTLDERVSGNVGGGGGGSGGRRDNGSLSDRVGNLFGAGSRNNFLNILGRSTGALTSFFTKFPSLIGDSTKAAKGFFDTFAVGFINMQAKTGSVLIGGIGGIGAVLTKIGPMLPAFAAAIVAIGLAMTFLVSIVNGLVAALTALTATIASALTGALLVGSAGFAAFAAAVSLVVVSFTSLTDAQSALLSDAFLPLKAELTGIGQILLRDLIPAFSQWSRNLQVALAIVVPLANVMGGALADAGNALTAALSGPGFQLFVAMLTQTLPSITRDMSAALGSFLNGLLGTFAALLPFVQQFASYLARVAAEFSDWATSAQGQNAIVDFAARALASLHQLWDFLGALGGLLKAVLFSPEAQNAGGTIFGNMTNALRDFTAYISQEDRLQKWLEQGITFSVALGETIKTVGQILQSLNQSGILDGIAAIAKGAATAYQWFSGLPRVLQDVLVPLKGVSDLIGFIGKAVGVITGSHETSKGVVTGRTYGPPTGLDSTSSSIAKAQAQVDKMFSSLNSTISSTQKSGMAALNATSKENGGLWTNPYTEWANSLVKNGPSIAAQMKAAMKTVNKQVLAAISSATRADDAAAVRDSLASVIDTMKSTAKTQVSNAQSALSSAASSLAGATTQSAVDKALKEVRKAQKNVEAALKNQKKINVAAKQINAQRVLTNSNVVKLLQGVKVANATLADYAAARAHVVQQIEDANAKLAEAISIRNDYAQSITESARTFAALTSAQASVIDGVQQALTTSDITSNLKDRLSEIKTFQSNLQILLAQGLSNSAYKQLVDAGVETGGAFAQALVNGGAGGVQQVNSLVAQIDTATAKLGTDAASRLYQAGVDAAQGLVDGLNSLSSQLDAAATKLGNTIAAAVKKSLGIKSPSRVMIGYMDYVGDGAVIGLDNQSAKVGAAARRFSDNIAVSPEVAAYAARQSASATVSGNGGQPVNAVDITVITPTEDPHAVATEVMNEVTGRL